MEVLNLSGAWRWLVAMIGGALGLVFGPPWFYAFTAWCALALLDTMLSMIAKGRQGALDPVAADLGWRRKAASAIIQLAVAIVQSVAPLLSSPDLASVPAAMAVTGGYIMVELLSILRNAAACGAGLPTGITMAFPEGRARLEKQTNGTVGEPAAKQRL